MLRIGHKGADAIRPGNTLESFAVAAESDGRTRERIDLIFLTGWAPDPSQPQPARRGSGGTSLAQALLPR